MVDTFSLKILALLMSRGTIKEKTNLFFDLVHNKQNRIEGNESIKINDHRLMRAIKEILYFSEIFPKQFHSHFRREMQLSVDLGKIASTEQSTSLRNTNQTTSTGR